MLDIKLQYPEVFREKWKTCRLCGGMYSYADLWFESGETEPTVDETLTGATSGHTGVVVSVTLTDGAWDDDDAVGFVELKTLTGADTENETIFTEGETVSGSEGGSFTVKEPGYYKRFGILHPKSNMIKAEDGHWYCDTHFSWRFDRQGIDDTKVDITEENRGKE